MKVKPVFRMAGTDWLFRLFRVTWTRGTVGDGTGYSCKLSLGLYPRIAGFIRGWNEWRLYVLGLRIHFQRDFGGIHV